MSHAVQVITWHDADEFMRRLQRALDARPGGELHFSHLGVNYSALIVWRSE